MIETDGLRALLLANATVTALVGSSSSARIYPLVLPQSPRLPALTFQRISGFPGITFSGPDGTAFARIQIDAWASSYADVKELAAAVRTCLHGFRGRVGSEELHLVTLESESDLFESQVSLYRVSMDWIVHYEEGVPAR